MRILGVNLSNNGSICLLNDGKIELYLEAERLTRKKRDYDCSELLNLVEDVDKIAISDACWNRDKKKSLISSKLPPPTRLRLLVVASNATLVFVP